MELYPILLRNPNLRPPRLCYNESNIDHAWQLVQNPRIKGEFLYHGISSSLLNFTHFKEEGEDVFKEGFEMENLVSRSPDFLFIEPEIHDWKVEDLRPDFAKYATRKQAGWAL
ncbi:hypothetical protein AVEN_216182-1 [Araneus ventricosus]|uniref:Uncharacterized protein n=1 Tax=Araneus ventricosus TaxID=182803 RepID=A0A4Y2QGN3_ARAVE|nr:hypothetical protein AVEN_216182-1 [Araneus ventricosus]